MVPPTVPRGGDPVICTILEYLAALQRLGVPRGGVSVVLQIQSCSSVRRPRGSQDEEDSGDGGRGNKGFQMAVLGERGIEGKILVQISF